MSSDDTGGTGPVTGGTPRPTRSGPGIGSTLSIIVAAVAVILGFFILRDINDDGGSSSGGKEPAATTSTVAESTTSAAAATSTTLTTTGFTVVVANASGVSGSAKQMSTYLTSQGFEVEEPTNAASSVGQLAATQVYYLTGFQAGAESVAISMGLDPATVLPMISPVPTESGSLGDASVLVMLGTDLAGKEIGGSTTSTTVAGATGTTTAETTTTTTG
jgi:hypothetical protein